MNVEGEQILSILYFPAARHPPGVLRGEERNCSYQQFSLVESVTLLTKGKASAGFADHSPQENNFNRGYWTVHYSFRYLPASATPSDI